MRQDQFLDVVDRDEAERRFRSALDLRPLPEEEVALPALLGRVLARDVVAPVDVPGFDRSNVDGYAVRACDTFGCSEEAPARLAVLGQAVIPGMAPQISVRPGSAIPIATGAVVPRGADAVVMVEHTDLDESNPPTLLVRRPVTPGANITGTGTDIGLGETVLWQGELLTSRETGVLAALGLASAWVVRRPRVAILSTGDELVAPGQTLTTGQIYDSNSTVLGDAVRELGGEPVWLGIVPDDREQLRQRLLQALECDVVLLSGGTSKGVGDLNYRVIAELGQPGILAHGVALKPGKPLCLAAIERPGRRTVPVAVLPGFPTSAVFTFHEFIAPVILALGGRAPSPAATVQATLPMRVNSERGRTEFLLVGLVDAGEGKGLSAYPMGKGSGSVTAFGRADGFVTIDRQREYLEAGETVMVRLLGSGQAAPDLSVIGSHCVGLDYLLGLLRRQGFRTRLLSVGSMGGLQAARRGECDLAGVHLFDSKTGTYNLPFLTSDLELIPGYGRLQGLIFRPGDARFAGKTVEESVRNALADPECVLANRNRGSGTRILIDRLLGEARPPGYWTESRSHNAVVAAVAQGRADWGVALASVAVASGLAYLPLQEERYDFATPRSRRDRPAVQAFRALLADSEVRQELQRRGFLP